MLLNPTSECHIPFNTVYLACYFKMKVKLVLSLAEALGDPATSCVLPGAPLVVLAQSKLPCVPWPWCSGLFDSGTPPSLSGIKKPPVGTVFVSHIVSSPPPSHPCPFFANNLLLSPFQRPQSGVYNCHWSLVWVPETASSWPVGTGSRGLTT